MPLGLSTAITLRQAGLHYALLEKEDDIVWAVRHYPPRKLVQTQPFEIPGYGALHAHEIPKEELMALWTEVPERSGVAASIAAGQTVTSVQPDAH